MTSERDIKHRISDQDTEKDAEGQDTGASKDTRSFDRVAPHPANDEQSTVLAGGPRVQTAATIGAPPINVPNVVAVPTATGFAYYFTPPTEDAMKIGVAPSVHIGDDDGSGSGIGAISAAASQMYQDFSGRLAKYNEENLAETENRELDGAGHQRPIDSGDSGHQQRMMDEFEEGAVVGAANGHVTAYAQDQNAALIDPVTGDTGLQDEAHRYDPDPKNASSVKDFDQGEPFGDPFPIEHTRDNDHPDIEAIPIGAAGTPAFAPRDHEGDTTGAAALIPQAARDTPHEPLDPKKPPSRVLGTNSVPQGDLGPEMQNIPGQPSAESPELQPK